MNGVYELETKVIPTVTVTQILAAEDGEDDVMENLEVTDYEEWDTEALKDQIEARNIELKSINKADMICALRKYDAATEKERRR